MWVQPKTFRTIFHDLIVFVDSGIQYDCLPQPGPLCPISLLGFTAAWCSQPLLASSCGAPSPAAQTAHRLDNPPVPDGPPSFLSRRGQHHRPSQRRARKGCYPCIPGWPNTPRISSARHYSRPSSFPGRPGLGSPSPTAIASNIIRGGSRS